MCALKIGVLITTTTGRIDLLINRSLKSVLNQQYLPNLIIIVDDYADDNESQLLESKLQDLKSELQIFHISNSRTKFMSGTGAWNTGFEFLSEYLGPDSYVAILDDDDEWDKDYLKESVSKIIESNYQGKIIISFLKRSDCEFPSIFSLGDLTIDNFLIGNPGIQGSNMLFKLDLMQSINGFDETLNSCTDRDLLIRVLDNNKTDNIFFTGKTLVNHYSWEGAVTNQRKDKINGLNSFYNKYIERFEFEVLLKSLNRAKRLFSYPECDKIIDIYRNSKYIMITGVCGMVGSALASTLVDLGYNVIGIDNLSTGTITNIKDILGRDNFEFHNISILQVDDLETLFTTNIYAVFHLAAKPRIKFSEENEDLAFENNVQSTINIASLSQKYNVKRFIYSSSSSVYGDICNDEMYEYQDLNPLSVYAKHKVICEQLLKEYTGIDIIITRLFNVYGYTEQKVDEYSLLIHKAIDCITNNKTLNINGDGEQKRDFTYIDDVVKGFINCLESYDKKSNYEVINIGNNNPYSVNEVIQKIFNHTKSKCNISHTQFAYKESKFTKASITKGFNFLSWSPTISLDEGISKTIAKYKNKEVIVIGIAMHNNANTIRRCIMSIIKQIDINRRICVVLVDDNSTDNWKVNIEDILQTKNIKFYITKVYNNNVVKTRNYINNYIIENIINTQLIIRLDADDELHDSDALLKLERILDSENPDYILAGNSLRQNNLIIERTNTPSENLKNKDFLIDVLKKMSECDETYELPSCNLIMRPYSLKSYPDLKSAEDHALLTEILLESNNHKIHIAKDILLTCYNLSGCTTMQNKKSNIYKKSREDIYNKAKSYIHEK